MVRILLFLATNAAILVVISVVFNLLGIDGVLQQNNVDLNLQALLIMSAVSPFQKNGLATEIGFVIDPIKNVVEVEALRPHVLSRDARLFVFVDQFLCVVFLCKPVEGHGNRGLL